MSPEQLAGEKLDPRTDIYSLGLVLFNMLTGQLPYPKLTSKETLVRRLTSSPATLADVRPDVRWPAAVQAVLSRALDPEPDRRYANVADLGRAIVAASASTADADPDATMRVPVAERPRLAASPRSAAGTPMPTRKLPVDAPPKRGWLRILGTAVVLLVIVAASFLAMHVRRGAGAAPLGGPAVADSTRAAGDSTIAAAGKAGSTAASPDSTPPHSDSAQLAAAPVVTRRKKSPPAPATPNQGASMATRRAGGSRPNAVSVEPRPPIASADADTVAAALREVRDHLDRGGQAVAEGRMLEANRQLRFAQTEMRNLREQMPGGVVPPALGRQLRALDQESVRACFSAAAGEPQATQRCRLLQQRESRAARGRGARPPVE